MTRLTIRNLTMPIAAFSMVFVLGGYIYGAVGAAKANASMEREKMYAQVLKQREELGLPTPHRRNRSGE
ncbi:hypothetical protein DB88DRAFT_512010 [Papiliotrema laurentii]|uniref:Uncharacterized protein n=1 Tax=Papiliotrema laurentii TaxID=5418 RepID=A0AAD9CY01_PAPLA|nr:hypothetical protein DB88DRAFT_512010 [Papiliotrema laurentii]